MTRSRINKAFAYFFSEAENLTLEDRLYFSALLIGMLICIVSAIIVIIISPSIIAVLANVLLFFSLVIIYWLAKFRRITEPFKMPIIIISFLGISTIWVFDGGIDGPDMMIAFVMLMLALIIVSDKNKKYIISVFITLVISIYLIQLLRPDLIVKIPSETNHWFDSFLTAIYCSFFIFLIIRFLHKHYTIERKNAEESLSKFRNYIDHAPDGIFVINSAGSYIDVNSAACRLLGYTKEELLVMHISQVSAEENSRKIKQSIDILKTSGKYSEEIKFTRKNGSVFIGLLDAVKIEENQFLVFVKDISERKKIEKEIRMLANAMKSINDCVSITDNENTILFVNEAFLKVYGYTEDEVVGRNISIVTSPNNIPGIVEEILASTLRGRWEGELLNIKKDGSEFPVHLSTSIIYNEDSKPIALIGVSLDMTKRKKSQDELINLNNQLRGLNADKDRFMSILAHDLKSPFNSLLGFSELLIENIHTYDIDTIEKQVKIINETANNTYNLLEDTLMWARAQSGKIPFKPQILIYKDICTEVSKNLKINADNKNITINHFAEDGMTLFADNDMLKTVMRNLISNAIKFTNPGGEINIYAEQTNDNVMITVSDNGVGINRDEITILFDASQFHSTIGTDGEKGTGLGLILCKDFLEKHGGKIWVESEEGKGTEFKFTIPG